MVNVSKNVSNDSRLYHHNFFYEIRRNELPVLLLYASATVFVSDSWLGQVKVIFTISLL